MLPSIAPIGATERRIRRTPDLRLISFILLSVTAFGLLGVGANWAAAGCAAPRVELSSHEIAPGESVLVTGEFWARECYDEGPPPTEKVGLGNAITDITVSVIQGDKHWDVAKGAADDAYRFSVEVPIPADVQPGPAQLVASFPGGGTFNSIPGLTILEPTEESTEIEPRAAEGVARFGPERVSDAERGGAPRGDAESNHNLLITSFVKSFGAAGLVLVLALMLRRWRSSYGSGRD